MKNRTLQPARNGEELRAQVLRAARECFLRYGVQRTSMADVAKAVGISRQALYRVVPSAGDLLEAVLVERVREMGDELGPILEAEPSFTEAMLKVSLAAVEGARQDEELQNFFETTTTLRLHHLMTGHFPEVRDIVLQLFRPTFERARASGELREDVTDEQMVDWIRGVYLMLILRDDLTPEEEREMILQFLIPSLTCRQAGSSRSRSRATAQRRGAGGGTRGT